MDLKSATDEALAIAAARDEAGAFAELLKRYQAPLLSFLRRQTMRLQDAEDLLQETVLRLYASRLQFRSRWRFRTWAFTIARRASIDLHRKQSRERVKLSGYEQQHPESTTSAEDSADDRSLNIWSIARAVLTREQADALWLFHVEDIPPREIAIILDRSWVSVKTMLHRARKQVRATLEDRESQEVVNVRTAGGRT